MTLIKKQPKKSSLQPEYKHGIVRVPRSCQVSRKLRCAATTLNSPIHYSSLLICWIREDTNTMQLTIVEQVGVA
jgi:hypothetical protein|uniref:Uncharacterized protein n=1 Tax=Populus trichocarpa TaxID=3694 RepID=A0A2K1WTU3_POPTR